jgi:hypothetical protein
MSKNTDGILGGQQGKIGTVVCYIVNGQARYRGYNDHHRKSNSKEAKKNRNRFAVLSHLASKFGYITNFTLAYMTNRDNVSSPHHMFVRINNGSFTTDGEPDFSRLNLGDGQMASVAIDNVETLADNNMIARKVTFSTLADGASFPTDMVHFALYFKEHDEALFASAIRGQNEVSIKSPAKWEGDTKYLYAVAVNTREVDSNSHLGTIHPKESSKTFCVEL